MFNNYRGGDTSVQINAVAGSLLKNHPKSWFEYFHLNSERAERLFREGGDRGITERSMDGEWREKSPAITVLQMMLCGEGYVLAECVYTKDFEEAISDAYKEGNHAQ